jgi:hypothetical protein
MMENIKSEIIRPALISAGYAALRKSRFHGRKGNLILARHYRMCSLQMLARGSPHSKLPDGIKRL